MSKKTFQEYLLYFFSSFITYTFIVIFIVKDYTEDSLIAILFGTSGYTPPLIINILLLALVTGIILILFLKFFEGRKEKRVEDALKMLNSGQYSAQIFLDMFSEDMPHQVNDIIDKEFMKLHEKMMLISEEAVSSAQQASTISAETREEILETERHRIARELHDSVSQQLFAAAMLLSTVEAEADSLPEHIQSQLKVTSRVVADAQSEMRALLLHLRPIKLDNKSLKQGIEQILDELKTKLPIKISHEIEEIKLAEVVEDHLFRIIQELISNVLRHAKATELEVYFRETADFYQLRFVDDGKGFDMLEKKNSGHGLRNIKERIAGLGGNVKIISFPGQGTSVEIRIPLITGG